ncbi:MAG: DUF1697 domain-containing protein [Gemmatimonadota bacterium]
MTRYAAFLRAINVGGHNVKMDRLRALFAEFGCAEVSTHIASGNVMFSAADPGAPELEARIEAGLEGALGYGVATFLRTPEELAAILEAAPLSEAPEGATVYIGFTRGPLTPAEAERVVALGGAEDSVNVEGSQIYWSPGGRFSHSKLTGATFERALGRAVTFRNDRTVRKVAEKLAL